MRILRLFWPAAAGAIFIPTSLGRLTLFKLIAEATRIPPARALMRRAFAGLMSADVSQWDRALTLPHYNAKAMPAASVHQARGAQCWAR